MKSTLKSLNLNKLKSYVRYINPYFKYVAFSTTTNTDSVDFGYKEVEREEKESMVKEVFNRVATRYDLMNDVMSVGVHRLWKDELINMIGFESASKTDPNWIPRHLDVAGGTGDIAFRVLKELNKSYPQLIHLNKNTNANELPDADRQVVVCDINAEMLSVGRDRARKTFNSDVLPLIGFVEGNAEKLDQFPDKSFDVYTIAFGLRNVTNKDAALKEAFRVLKPGGRLLIMEFSHVNNPLLKEIYDSYSMNVIPRLGQVFADDADSYQYLVESIRRFPNQEDLMTMMRSSGFGAVSYRDFTFGVVAVHSGFKLP